MDSFNPDINNILSVQVYDYLKSYFPTLEVFINYLPEHKDKCLVIYLTSIPLLDKKLNRITLCLLFEYREKLNKNNPVLIWNTALAIIDKFNFNWAFKLQDLKAIQSKIKIAPVMVQDITERHSIITDIELTLDLNAC